jgi:hypothetical protein
MEDVIASLIFYWHWQGIARMTFICPDCADKGIQLPLLKIGVDLAK